MKHIKKFNELEKLNESDIWKGSYADRNKNKPRKVSARFTEPHGGKNFNSVVWSDEIDQIQPKIDEIWGSISNLSIMQLEGILAGLEMSVSSKKLYG